MDKRTLRRWCYGWIAWIGLVCALVPQLFDLLPVVRMVVGVLAGEVLVMPGVLLLTALDWEEETDGTA